MLRMSHTGCYASQRLYDTNTHTYTQHTYMLSFLFYRWESRGFDELRAAQRHSLTYTQ